MHTVDAVLDRTCAVAKLGQHAAADKAVLDQLLRLCRCDSGNKGRLVIDIFVQALDVRQKGELLRTDCLCNRTRCVVRIDIVRLKMLIETDWRHDGQKILFN